MLSWRVVKPEFAPDAFSGRGARLYGGRWNPRGTALVYTSATLSLATLELLVGTPRAQRLPEYAAFRCSVPARLIEELDPALLPATWRSYPAPPQLQQIGNEWVTSLRSAALAVPSAVIESEMNLLLNPAHPDFGRIEISEVPPLRFDLRLVT